MSIDYEMIRDIESILTYPSNPGGGQTTQHCKQIECKETGNRDEETLRNDKIGICPLNVRINCWENGQGHEENEEDVEQLRASLLENLPVRRSGLGFVISRTTFLGVLFLKHFVITIEFLKWKKGDY